MWAESFAVAPCPMVTNTYVRDDKLYSKADLWSHTSVWEDYPSIQVMILPFSLPSSPLFFSLPTFLPSLPLAFFSFKNLNWALQLCPTVDNQINTYLLGCFKSYDEKYQVGWEPRGWPFLFSSAPSLHLTVSAGILTTFSFQLRQPASLQVYTSFGVHMPVF